MLRERASRPRQLAGEISGIIFKSKPTVYKKMQGNIALTMDELIAICSHYHLDLDPLLHQTPSFNSVLLDSGNEKCGPEEALFTEVNRWSVNPATRVIIDVSDLFTYAFLNPEIAALILFGERQRHDKSLKFSMFDAIYDPRMSSLASRISNAYRSVRRIEIWHETMFDNVLMLISQCLKHDSLARPTEALRLCDVVHKNLLQLHERYLSKLDRSTGHVQIRLTDDRSTSNYVCVRIGDNFALYQGLWYRNWTLTYSPLVAKPAFENLEKSVAKSAPGFTPKVDPDTFFGRLAEKIMQTRRNIERQLYSVAQ